MSACEGQGNGYEQMVQLIVVNLGVVSVARHDAGSLHANLAVRVHWPLFLRFRVQDLHGDVVQRCAHAAQAPGRPLVAADGDDGGRLRQPVALWSVHVGRGMMHERGEAERGHRMHI